LILTVLTLIFIGILMIHSANGRDPGAASEARRQLMYAIFGLFLMILFIIIDYDFLGRISPYLYSLTIILLVAVLVVGHTVQGAQRWVSLGPLGTFQPSEMAKLAIIITLARYLSLHERWRLRELAIASALVTLPWVLILIQPDLGTALVLVAVTLILFYFIGIKPWIIFTTLAAGFSIAPFILHDYQKKRLLTFINPEGDPAGDGWNLIQAKIAIGSGKIWGKGIFLGTQNQLNFVPEHSTDFIFTIVGEELGMVGALGILVLYFYLLWQGITVARESRDLFGSLLAVGIVAMFGFHIFVNMGMNIGIMPVAGIPLPFISYGGSSLLTSMIAIGILGSIYFRRGSIF